MDKEKAFELAERFGFSHWGVFPTDKLYFRQEVRDMCEVNKCGKYDSCWTCPPACGTLEEITEEAKKYTWGLLLQTTATLEDDFDIENMMQAAEDQKVHFNEIIAHLREEDEDFLPMSSGACTVCETCTYPDAPCRFPKKAIPSMEAYGLVVSDVCTLADTPYYYGEKTLTYTGCILFR